MVILDSSIFIGRFHSLMVHLPIGFLILVILWEWTRNRKKEAPTPTLSRAWFLVFISALIAAVMGWLLAESGWYTPDSVFWHRWLGVFLTLLTGLGWGLRKYYPQGTKKIQNLNSLVLIILIFFVGHLGGQLTHGEAYLTEYAPKPLKNFLTKASEKDSILLAEKDSVLVFQELIQPVLQAKCVACHNNQTSSGGLDLSSSESLMSGGVNGAVIIPGNPYESTLFQRLVLAPNDPKFMPPNDNALSFEEVKLLEWWIRAGAEVNTSLHNYSLNEEMQAFMIRNFDLDTRPRPWYETVRIPAADSVAIDKLKGLGFSVKALGAENNLLDVRFEGETLTEDAFNGLLALESHISWFSLAGVQFDDAFMQKIGQFPNLTRLKLERSSIGDLGVSYLIDLPQLISLNLYGTRVTAEAVPFLSQIKGLQRVYLWQTEISPENLEALRQAAPELEVIGGSGTL